MNDEEDAENIVDSYYEVVRHELEGKIDLIKLSLNFISPNDQEEGNNLIELLEEPDSSEKPDSFEEFDDEAIWEYRGYFDDTSFQGDGDVDFGALVNYTVDRIKDVNELQRRVEENTVRDSVGIGDLLEPFEQEAKVGDKAEVEIEYDENVDSEDLVEGDYGLRTVFSTLAKNWRVHGGNEQYVGIRMDEDLEDLDSDSYVIEFQDNGGGLDGETKEQREKEFEKQIGVVEGEGQDENETGLPMACKVLEEYGGEIEYEEDIAEGYGGFGVKITLPKYDANKHKGNGDVIGGP